MKKNIRTWLAVAGFMACAAVPAQNLHINGKYAAGNVEAIELYIAPIGGAASQSGVKMNAADKMFDGDVPVSETGFYMLYGRNGGSQVMTPMYVPAQTTVCNLKLSIDGSAFNVDSGKDNKALLAYSKLLGEKDRFFWTEGKALTPDALRTFLESYRLSADSIAKRMKCSEPVKQYLNLWACTSAWNNYGAIPRVMGLKMQDLPFTREDLFGDVRSRLDTPLASCFSSVSFMVMEELPKNSTMTESLAWLFDNYTSTNIRSKVADQIVDKFVRRFDYSRNYEQGLAELNDAIAKYGVDPHYADEFAKRRSSVQGSGFPDIELVDAEGNKMDFGAFRGSYVYIDLWASWCGPCCKEVPYLKELEKELQNGHVKFLSISLDKDAAAWKAKMKALDMHGNQWLDSTGQLGNALNVQGIPRFMIYNKEGQLYNANAPRPSNPETRELLESLK